MEILIKNIQNIPALGLFWDGLGVFILGIGSIFKLKNEIASEASSYYDFNKYEIINKVSTKIDTTVGSCFLLVGFALQFVASINIILPIEFCITFWIIAAVMFIYYYMHGKAWLTNNWVTSIVKSK